MVLVSGNLLNKFHQPHQGRTNPDDLWDLGSTPINIYNLEKELRGYDKKDASFILSGFKHGFSLNYSGPRIPLVSENLKSAKMNSDVLSKKLKDDKALGWIACPFVTPPISNLRINPVGLVPKRSGGWRLITNLSFPEGHSVNDFVEPDFRHVNYALFDRAVTIVQTIGKSAFCCKADIKSAFNLCPVAPADFDLLGIKSEDGYWVQKMLPQGSASACFIFEKFASFLDWLIKKKSGTNNITHLLDDFFMAGSTFIHCRDIFELFQSECFNLGIPLCPEKLIGPLKVITYLGLDIDAEKQTIRVPDDKIDKAKIEISRLLSFKKIRLSELQSIDGLLNFITKAIPTGRAFLRRFYDAMSHANKPHHFIRVNNGMRDDASIWLSFLNEFNGVAFFNESEWFENTFI